MLTHHLESYLQSPTRALGEDDVSLFSHRVLDHLQVAIAVLNTQGTVLFRNLRAQQLDEGSTLVKITIGRRLRFRDISAQGKWHAALRRIADRASFGEEDSLTIVASEPEACKPPLIGTFRLLSDTPHAVLATFADSGGALCEASLKGFSRAFSLTQAEQRLTHYLASGGRLGSAARSFGVSPRTVRNQLHSIFAKVGVQRQADLMRLILAGCAYGLIAQAHRTADACAQMTDMFF